MPLMRGAGWLLVATALLLALAGCGREPLVQSRSYVFGTLVDISIYGEDEARAQALTSQVLREFQRLHDGLHAWQPSDLSRLNDAFAAGNTATVTPELAGIINDAARISAQSDGLFNPAIGHLIKQWGFHSDEFVPQNPDPAKIGALVAAAPGMADIAIDGVHARSRNPAVKLDLGGYAKGYALDRALELLRREKVHGALVNIGGNIIALGKHGDVPWRIGIQHPRQPGPIATLELADGWAIGTSGDYQRFFELDGKRYCHIIDPRSGYPVQGVQAVTVLIPPGAQAGTLSDAVSKPVFINAPDWRATARKVGVEHVMLIDAQGTVHLTQAMRERIKFVEKNVRLEVVP
jgi:thiamine biosynthesis lipoprotein